MLQVSLDEKDFVYINSITEEYLKEIEGKNFLLDEDLTIVMEKLFQIRNF